jgi:hypothetical protein
MQRDYTFSVVYFVLCDFVFELSLFHFSRVGKINTLVCYVFVCEGKRKIGTNAEEGWNNGGKVELARASNILEAYPFSFVKLVARGG